MPLIGPVTLLVTAAVVVAPPPIGSDTLCAYPAGAGTFNGPAASATVVATAAGTGDTVAAGGGAGTMVVDTPPPPQPAKNADITKAKGSPRLRKRNTRPPMT